VNRLLIILSLFGSSAYAVDFSQDVLPVLQRACFECHGSDVAKAGLRLDKKTGALKGSEHGAVIVPGKPEESELLRRVSLPRTDKKAMPRRGAPLKQDEIAKLKDWITAGAVWPDSVTTAKHWAYIPPVKAEVPKAVFYSQGNHDSVNPIDAFVAERLQQAELKPSPEAPAYTLIRRVFFDLTGLPPTPEALQQYLPKSASEPLSSETYTTVVDDLLKSPEFGVKWARHWLDLARYADSHGFQRDDLREIWAYRDWVVKALNEDMPFDQFTLEQVAGDLLPNPTPDQIIATGFHRCTPTNVEAGTEPEESRINQVIDRVNTTGAVWLGSTLECAQCHNHKYDPFSQKDYYQMLAYFNNTAKEAERTNPKTPGSIQFDGVPYAMEDASKVQARKKLIVQMKGLQERLTKEESKPEGLEKATPEKTAIVALKPMEIQTTSSAKAEVQADQSILFTGEVPNADTYTVTFDLTPGPISGLMIEALTDPSLAGNGPGRGGADRPNFVLQQMDVSVLDPQGTSTALSFEDAYASFSQKKFEAAGLIDQNPSTGWAINPQFHKAHWAAFSLNKPVQAQAGMKLRVRLVQAFGGGRVIGKLRVSGIRGAVAECLPVIADESEGSEKGPKKSPAIVVMERELKKIQRELDALKPATTEVMKELPQPRMTAIFKRGVYTDPLESVTAATPAIFEQGASGPPNRLSLAKWLASRKNPLVARVMVNRLWTEIFGQGIVTTVEDFGIKGAAPSHPELLDWLAVEFMDQGWSLKKILREIVLSHTYRQSSRIPVNAKGLEVDAVNSLLWRGPRFRLDAEAIRDNALAISGLLSLKKGGESIRPPQPEGLWAKVGGQQYKYEVSPGEMQYRRGLYVVLKRGAPYPSFMNFDASARMACVVKRSRSNTPLQALTLLNDPVYVAATHAFAQRMATEPDAQTRIQLGFRLALAREPAPEEVAIMKQLYDAQYSQGEGKALEWSVGRKTYQVSPGGQCFERHFHARSSPTRSNRSKADIIVALNSATTSIQLYAGEKGGDGSVFFQNAEDVLGVAKKWVSGSR